MRAASRRTRLKATRCASTPSSTATPRARPRRGLPSPRLRVPQERRRSSGESSAGIRDRIDERTLWERVVDEATFVRLSADGRLRLARFREAFNAVLTNRLRGSLRERVENSWLALGGPACVQDDTDLEDAEIYLDYLEESEEAGELAHPAAFERGLDELYALPHLHPGPDEPPILPIHKAQGLEI